LSALDIHAKQPIDLIILDWVLPELDGLEVLRRLRQHSATPVLMLTGRVRQIILNLMSNAIKFTKADSVTLQAQVEADFVRISVIDTGIGIPAKALPYIFDRFQHAEHDTSKHYGGTGLGLDISKQLTHMHGGQITVSSVVGQGSVFLITLPIAQNQPTPAIEAPKIAHGSINVFEPQMTDDLHEATAILILVHEIGMRNLTYRVLQGTDYIVLDADDTPEAMQITQDLSPDLIVLGHLDDWVWSMKYTGTGRTGEQFDPLVFDQVAGLTGGSVRCAGIVADDRTQGTSTGSHRAIGRVFQAKREALRIFKPIFFQRARLIGQDADLQRLAVLSCSGRNQRRRQ
jgi:CheY-like chemotaxis protein